MYENLIKKATKLARFEYGYKDHFSFILCRKKVICMGRNHYKTSPYPAKHNYRFPYIHSELDAIRNFPWTVYELSKCRLVNLRLDLAGRPTIAMPCEYCGPVIEALNFKEVLFSNWDGQFVSW